MIKRNDDDAMTGNRAATFTDTTAVDACFGDAHSLDKLFVVCLRKVE